MRGWGSAPRQHGRARSSTVEHGFPVGLQPQHPRQRNPVQAAGNHPKRIEALAVPGHDVPYQDVQDFGIGHLGHGQDIGGDDSGSDGQGRRGNSCVTSFGDSSKDVPHKTLRCSPPNVPRIELFNVWRISTKAAKLRRFCTMVFLIMGSMRRQVLFSSKDASRAIRSTAQEALISIRRQSS